MLFEYVRLSLFQREGLDLDWRRREDGRPFESREQWLRDIFSRDVPFLHRKKEYVFVPDADAKDAIYIVGRIGRRTVSVENEPPTEDLHETTREVWRAALTFVDPRDHTDGQKVAMETTSLIGRPTSVLSSFANAINARLPSEPYLIEAHGIADPQTFWQYVAENPASITSITLEVAAPNMFRSVDDFSQEMRELRDEEKVRTAKIELNNSDGLNPNTKRIRDAVDYTVKGGGAIKARAKNKKPYNSRNKTRKVKVPKQVETADKASILLSIKDALSRIFGAGE